jgi:hypothetical protein
MARPNQFSSEKRRKELERAKKKEEKLKKKQERKAAIAAGLIDEDGNPLDADGNISDKSRIYYIICSWWKVADKQIK